MRGDVPILIGLDHIGLNMTDHHYLFVFVSTQTTGIVKNLLATTRVPVFGFEENRILFRSGQVRFKLVVEPWRVSQDQRQKIADERLAWGTRAED